MVSYRRLPPTPKHPGGLWQASVYLPIRLPNGQQKRATRSHPLKGAVRAWAVDLEAKIAAGTWHQPRAGELTLAQWRVIWSASRFAAESTWQKDESHWRRYIAPAFGGHPLTEITRERLLVWVKTLIKRRLGAWTIRASVAHLSAMLQVAVDTKRLPTNPARGLDLPRADAKPIFYWTRTEAKALLSQLAGPDALLADLDLHIGMRIGEVLGLRRLYVDADRWLIHVVGVQTRSGWREYPKSSRSRRPVPIPLHLRARFSVHIDGLHPDDYLFPTARGHPWNDRNFARRVFDPAVAAAGIRRGTPHDMRHTAASWLVQAGVDLYRVQALLGHESYATTQRYAHLAPDAFEAVQAAWTSLNTDLAGEHPDIAALDEMLAEFYDQPEE